MWIQTKGNVEFVGIFMTQQLEMKKEAYLQVFFLKTYLIIGVALYVNIPNGNL
jgi:hypothetical protein